MSGFELAVAVYMYSVLGSTVSLFLVALIGYAFALSFAFVAVIVDVDKDEDEDKAESVGSVISNAYLKLKRFIFVKTVCAMVIIIVLYPSKATLGTMIGAYATSELMQNKEAQKLPSNVFRSMNKFLERINDEKDI